MASAVAAVGLGAISATPAHAATVPLALDCRTNGPVSVTASPGDTLEVAALYCGAWVANYSTAPAATVGVVGYLGNPTLVSGTLKQSTSFNGFLSSVWGTAGLNDWGYYGSDYAGSGTPFSFSAVVQSANGAGQPLVDGAVLLMYQDTGSMNTWQPIQITLVATPPTAAADAGMPAVHQSVPMPVSADCSAVQDTGLAWGTGVSGGWSKAWEPWVAPEGGWACSRTLENRGGNDWVVAAG